MITVNYLVFIDCTYDATKMNDKMSFQLGNALALRLHLKGNREY